jgi:hypothetical protein
MHTVISNNKRKKKFKKSTIYIDGIEATHWHKNYMGGYNEGRKNMGTNRTNPRKRGS